MLADGQSVTADQPLRDGAVVEMGPIGLAVSIDAHDVITFTRMSQDQLAGWKTRMRAAQNAASASGGTVAPNTLNTPNSPTSQTAAPAPQPVGTAPVTTAPAAVQPVQTQPATPASPFIDPVSSRKAPVAPAKPATPAILPSPSAAITSAIIAGLTQANIPVTDATETVIEQLVKSLTSGIAPPVAGIDAITVIINRVFEQFQTQQALQAIGQLEDIQLYIPIITRIITTNPARAPALLANFLSAIDLVGNITDDLVFPSQPEGSEISVVDFRKLPIPDTSQTVNGQMIVTFNNKGFANDFTIFDDVARILIARNARAARISAAIKSSNTPLDSSNAPSADAKSPAVLQVEQSIKASPIGREAMGQSMTSRVGQDMWLKFQISDLINR